MDDDTMDMLQGDEEFVFEAYLAVCKGDQAMCEMEKKVPRRIYAATGKTYIGLRIHPEAAVDRANCLFGKATVVDKSTVFLLRSKFSQRGFVKYATKTLGPEDAYSVMLHQITFPGDKANTDYGMWAFHGDLPLHERAEDGQVLIASEWMEIS